MALWARAVPQTAVVAASRARRLKEGLKESLKGRAVSFMVRTRRGGGAWGREGRGLGLRGPLLLVSEPAGLAAAPAMRQAQAFLRGQGFLARQRIAQQAHAGRADVVVGLGNRGQRRRRSERRRVGKRGRSRGAPDP